ncbi:MAG TPA: rhodanese-like domain-containing protein [Bryobacteraceae bacterium]|nr:rhodanese-like domain-containing protein [Bryobacteraceae bacterium]
MKAFIGGFVVVLTAAMAAEVALVQPKDLAAQLAARGARPAVIQVGPNLLYRSKHIPGAVFAGPGSRSGGLELLTAAVKGLPRDRDIVIYCGCCPWDRCPNIQPAFALLKQMGFTRVRAMYSATNFKTDWIDRGYPVGQ